MHADSLSEPAPIFPLPNCVLLPGAVLPLHVFEPRYRSLMRDVLYQAADRRLIGIALLCDDYEGLYQTNHAPIRPIVGVGQLIQHSVMDDGRLNVLLLGRVRARILAEEGAGEYRLAQLKVLPTEPDNMLATVDDSVDAVRSLLREMAELGMGDDGLVNRLLSSAPSAAAMVDLSTYHLTGPNEVWVKQLILEEEHLEVRAEILADQLRGMVEAWHAARRGGDRPSWPPAAGEN